MSGSGSDADHASAVAGVRAYFDAFAAAEWERLAETRAGQVSFEVHRRFLARFVKPGMRVLEVGAGPGRFTIELARLGCQVVTTDLSPVQLALNEQYVGAAGVQVERRELADICDLTAYETGEFDAAVAFGGPLSYAFDQADTAMAELLRVVRPSGPVLASVMSTLGAYRHFFAGVVSVVEQLGEDAADRILATGDLRETQPPGADTHSCRMFRWREVVELVRSCGASVVAASASNWASLAAPEELERVAASPERWRRFVDSEVALCAEPGVLDGSTHVIFAAARA